MLRTNTDRRPPNLSLLCLGVFFFIQASSAVVSSDPELLYPSNPSGNPVKRYRQFRSDFGKRNVNQAQDELTVSGENMENYLENSNDVQFAQEVRKRRSAEEAEMLSDDALNALTNSLSENDDLEKRYSKFRSDFGKRLFRSDFGKRMLDDETQNVLTNSPNENDGMDKRFSQFRSDFGKRLYRTDFGKRYSQFRSDFGKRLFRSDFGKRLYRGDLGKRLFRSDFGKRTLNDDDNESINYAGVRDKRAMFRSDLGKRRSAAPSWWYNRRVFRSDLGKRSAFRSDLG